MRFLAQSVQFNHSAFGNRRGRYGAFVLHSVFHRARYRLIRLFSRVLPYLHLSGAGFLFQYPRAFAQHLYDVFDFRHCRRYFDRRAYRVDIASSLYAGNGVYRAFHIFMIYGN